LRSIIETYEVETGRVTEVLAVEGRIEAPNWAPSGDWLLVNGEGRLYRVPLEKPALVPVDTMGRRSSSPRIMRGRAHRSI
jgi:hypothetical protein